MKLLISIRKPLLLFGIAFLTSLLFQSCKNAPAEGEAFITLKSNEVRPLADTEIIFFGSDFAEEFETFRTNLVAETKDELKSKLNQTLSTAQKELESLEGSRASIPEKARESKNKELQEQRMTLSKKVANLNDILKGSNSLAQKLDENFLKYSQSEAALAQKADNIRAEAHKLAVDLILKINKGIVSEKIPIPKYEETHKNPKLREVRSISQMIVSGSPSYEFGDLSGPSRDLCRQESGYVSIYGKNGFEISRIKHRLGREYDNGVFATYLSYKLNDSKIASEIRKDWRLIKNYEAQLETLEDQAEENNKTLNQAFQVYTNSTNATADSAIKQLRKRAEIEEAIFKANEELTEWQDGSEMSVKSLDSAIQDAAADLEQAIKHRREWIEEFKTKVSTLALGSGSEISDFAEEQEVIMQQAIMKFFDSKKLSSTRTGSDGKFAVPPKARYASSLLTREIQEEQLFWLIKIDLEDTSVKITNSNVTKAGKDRALLGALDCDLE